VHGFLDAKVWLEAGQLMFAYVVTQASKAVRSCRESALDFALKISTDEFDDWKSLTMHNDVIFHRP
jgi:hypothetical protein